MKNNKIKFLNKNLLNKIKFSFIFIFVITIFSFDKYLINNRLDYLNLYVVTHKDFNNILYNPYYKILCDDKEELKDKYAIKIIETYENNNLYFKKHGYGEGSKIYYIWKKYEKKLISSKYVGFSHYRRIFSFKNEIPNLNEIFNKYDVILKRKTSFKISMREQFTRFQYAKFFDEIIEIIKEKFYDYYPQAIKSMNKKYLYGYNIFIMKEKDFIEYGKFVFSVLSEFDRRHNLKNDKDIENLMLSEIKLNKKNYNLVALTRVQGSLMERISSIFYEYHFKKIYEIKIIKLLNLI